MPKREIDAISIADMIDPMVESGKFGPGQIGMLLDHLLDINDVTIKRTDAADHLYKHVADASLVARMIVVVYGPR